jgi:hypothetical protein
MPPPRLVELECPRCRGRHWVIDADFRAAFMAGGVDVDYDQREYQCRVCGQQGIGHKVLQKSPPTFLIDLGRVGTSSLPYWEAVLKEQFPDHSKVATSKSIHRTAVKRRWWRFW